MKIVISGGHLSPSLALIEKLKNDEVFYIGRKHSFEGDKAVSLEYQEIKKLNVRFFTISTARMQRKFTRYTLFSFLKFPVGFFQAYKIIKNIKPDVVIGFGGYISIPVILAAYFQKIPSVLHEQTLEAGFANKFLSKFASKILISWSTSADFFPKEKTVLTGNPLKQAVINEKKNEEDKTERPLIFVTGGSAGSHSINKIIEDNLSILLEKYRIIHQTGDSQKYKDYDVLQNIKNNLDEKLKENYTIKKFLTPHEEAQAMKNADLVIGRSGINTVTELIYLEKPSLLIPLPFAQNNEQKMNAEFIKNLGLAEVLDQNSLEQKEFIEKISQMFTHIENYRLNKKIIFENSSGKIIKVLKDVSKKKTT
jgi:UDP-N-acetylglucosamine--N-acetylmuramyl-(pentapeptide) pyrophosphoryl-undecaprenol N-acetylglucosamine transferase